MVKTSRPQAPVVFAASKVRVQVRADGCIYEGDVHLHGDARRIQEVLNDPRPFLNLTDVKVRGDGIAGTEASYLALNKGAITHVLLLSEDGVSAAIEPSRIGKGATTQPVLPTAVPAKGPITVPTPPADEADIVDELSVSDLLIEDDDNNDDLDLGDFEED